jgi:CO/xanthine dehydrogenase Mo-binding subunit
MTAVQSQNPFHAIGRSTERRDGMGHVTGTTEYVDDIRYPGMLHMKIVRNPLVHARIKGIDFSAAEQVPGFVRAFTAADVPKNVYTILCLIGVEPDEEQVLAAERARYRGEPIAADAMLEGIS